MSLLRKTLQTGASRKSRHQLCVALHHKGSVLQVVTSSCNVVVEENVADRRIGVKVGTSFLWHCTARVLCRKW